MPSTLAAHILELAHLPSTTIAAQLGCSARYARRVLHRAGLSHAVGAPHGSRNPSWRGGRMVDLDGYVLLETSPTRVSEHRHIMAQQLGRPLQPGEVVDHIDGLTIHNTPSNLRLFLTNGEHLAHTLTGRTKQFSTSGRQNIGARTDLGATIAPVDIYRLRKKRGDVRLLAILRAGIELGTSHPCLYGTRHWLEQIGIDPHSRPSLKRGMRALMRRYAHDLAQ